MKIKFSKREYKCLFWVGCADDYGDYGDSLVGCIACCTFYNEKHEMHKTYRAGLACLHAVFYNENHEMRETVRVPLRLVTETLFTGVAQPQSGGTSVATDFNPWKRRAP